MGVDAPTSAVRAMVVLGIELANVVAGIAQPVAPLTATGWAGLGY